MDQNNNPFFNNQPPQEPAKGPEETRPYTGGAQVYETLPPYQPPSGPSFTPPPPVAPPVGTPQGGGNKRRIWIIVLVVLLVLCLCCIATLAIAWTQGDAVMCMMDPTLSFCP